MRTVAVLGAGKIGEALLSGLLRGGWPAARVVATDCRPERAAEITERYGIRFVSNAETPAVAEVLAIAVKPQDAAALLTELGPALSPDTVIVSVCAGLPTSFFTSRLPAGTPVVRVMTNTPALIGEAMTAICAGTSATSEHLDLVETMFRPLGRTVILPEHQLDAVTALSGSGPAYFFFMIEAMIEAGVLLGLPRQIAHDLITQTAVGSAIMARDSGQHPAVLREAVTSPAGTTAAALRELENHRVRAAVLTALCAARDRSRELSVTG